MVLSCQRCRGVKIASRKGAKTQRKMELMVYWYVLDPQHLTGLVILGEKHLLFSAPPPLATASPGAGTSATAPP